MNPRLLILAALLLACGIAFGAVPSVNFSINPPVATINQPVVFDPTVTCNPDCNYFYWQFGTDGNINYIYLPGQDTNVIDGFETGTYNANWTVTSGTPAGENTVVKDGLWALKLPSASGMQIPVTKNADINYAVWIRGQTLTVGYRYLVILNSTGDGLAAMYLHNTASNGFAGDNGTWGNYTDFGPLATDNTWYGLVIDYNSNTNKFSFFALDSLGNTIGSLINIPSANAGTPFYLGLSSSATTDTNYDTVRNGDGVVSFPINVDKNETHAFATAGTKNITLFAGNKDGNTTVAQQLFIGTFKLSFYDENSLLPITPGLVTVNGDMQTLNGNQLVYQDLDSTPKDLNIVVSDMNYGTRNFYFHNITDANALDLNLFMLDNTRGAFVPFQFYHPDQIHKLANARIRVVRKNTDANNVSMVLTDGTGQATIFLNPDSNYTFNVDANNLGITDFTYKQLILTIKVPKDEISLSNVTPFHFLVTRNGKSYDQNNLSINTTVPLFPNTVDYYSIFVNKPTGIDYTNGRGYLYRIFGDPRTDSLQPYLASDAQGAFSSNITVVDLYTRFPQQNLILKVSTTNGDGVITSEKRLTDTAGSALLTFLINRDYSIEVDTNGTDANVLANIQLNAKSSTYYLTINIHGIDYNIEPGQYVDINYTQVNLHNAVFDVNWCATVISGLQSISWYVYDDKGTYLQTPIVQVGPFINNPICDGNTFDYQRPLGYGTLIYSVVTFSYSTFDVNTLKVYAIYSGSEIPLTQSANDLGDNFGLLGMTVIAILLALIVHGAASQFAFASTNGLFLLVAGIVGIFVLLGWVDITLFGMACLFSLFNWIYVNRGGG